VDVAAVEAKAAVAVAVDATDFVVVVATAAAAAAGGEPRNPCRDGHTSDTFNISNCDTRCP
jgi:hypothetical protein